jgi:hypothetical protein
LWRCAPDRGAPFDTHREPGTAGRRDERGKINMRSNVDFDWEGFLLQIEDRRVIPVVGPDLSVLSDETGERPLQERLATLLAERLDIAPSELPPDASLGDVAVYYANRYGRPQRVYARIKALMEELRPPVPRPLAQLAEITDFRLYLSTTFDNLLAQAVDNTRFGGNPRTTRLAYSPHLRLQDLPGSLEDLSGPVVYQFFGPLTSSTDYAVTDEDVLEFLHALQSAERRPKLLFDELRSNHLLIIGCGYSDWLARFFIRTLRNQRLSLRSMSEVIADNRTPGDKSLVVFLQQCAACDIFFEGGAKEFVDELHSRWRERRGPGNAAADVAQDPASSGAAMPADAVFLSYASEDRPTVTRLAERLDAAGIETWFDRRALRSGDDWDDKIRRNIKGCSLFLPILSRNSVRRIEGYFRKEWSWAVQRAQGMDDSFPFIQPVVIDELPGDADGVPSNFHARHWQRCPEGEPPSEFVRRVTELVREVRVRKAGLS